MNKVRRESIQGIATRLGNLRSELEALLDEEQGYLENMPESLQSSVRGEEAEEAIESLEGATSSIEEALSSLEVI